MAAGTKIFLAVAALLVVILVVYYTVNSPEASQLAIESPNPPRVETPASTPEPRVQPSPRFILPEPEPEPESEPEPEPLDDAPSVEEAIEETTAGETIAAAPDAESILDSLPDHAPVTPVDNQAGDAGKDAPDEPVPPRPEPTKDDAAAPPPAQHPATTPVQRPAPLTPPPSVEYTVREGETMSSIAADWFGEPGGAAKWDLIAKANPFVDPDRLSVGQVLRLPPKDARREQIAGRVGSTSTVYVVRSGDTLSRIALAYYGSSSMWRVIYEANRTTIGSSPNTLRVGMKLTIPPAPKPAEPQG